MIPARAIWAVVPVKELSAAKQRLAAVLGPEERAAFSLAMLADVLGALAAARGLGGVCVVSRDPRALELACSRGACALAESGQVGLNPALRDAASVLAEEGAATLLVVPADAPLVTGAEVDALLARHGTAPAVTLAPDHHGRGTNGLACSPPGAISPAFGPDSFVRHRAAARALGITPAEITPPGLARDIDSADDLARFAARPTATQAYEWLAERGIPARLRQAAAAARPGAAR